MCVHMRLQAVQEGQSTRRWQCSRAEPFAERHSYEVSSLLGQANGVLRLYSVGAVAQLIDKIVRQLLQRPIGSETDRGQPLHARDPPLQHIARHLQDDFRESVVEL